MNGNYEYVRLAAQEKQKAFAKEAGNHRLAKQAGRISRHRQAWTLFAWAGNRVQGAAAIVSRRTAGYAAR